VHRNPIGEATSLKIEDAWIDSLSEDVKLTGDSDVFYICRRMEAGHLLTWVGVYRLAAEMGAGRPGGFYGAGLWLINSVISSSAIYDVVINLANQIRDLALKDGKFVKRIADVRGAITPPPRVATLLDGSAQVTTGGLAVSSGDRVFISDPKNIIAIIDWAQKDVSADFFSHVIVGAPEQYVEQKSQFSKKVERSESISAAKDYAYRRRIAIQNAEHRKSELALTKLTEDQQKYALTLTELNKKVISYETEVKARRAAQAKAESNLLALQKKIAADRDPSAGRNEAANEPYQHSFFYLGTCIAFLVVEIILAVCGYLFLEPLIARATAKKQGEIIRLENEKTEWTRRPTKESHDNLLQENKNLKRDLDAQHQQNQRHTLIASTENRLSENPKDGSESSCNVEFQRLNYRIFLDVKIANSPKDEPKRVDIFNKIIEKCGTLTLENASCPKTLSKIKSKFTNDIEKLDGQIWLPSSCQILINGKEKNYATGNNYAIELKK
jgi:hypothetical protein